MRPCSGEGMEQVNTTHTKALERDDVFLNMVDFKWLMAGVGWWVNLSRLQSDSTYIDECLQRALRSGSELLRQRSIELLGLGCSSDAGHQAAMESESSAFAL